MADQVSPVGMPDRGRRPVADPRGDDRGAPRPSRPPTVMSEHAAPAQQRRRCRGRRSRSTASGPEPAAAVEQAAHAEDGGEGDARAGRPRRPARASVACRRVLIGLAHPTPTAAGRGACSGARGRSTPSANGLSRVTRSAGIAGRRADRRARIPRRAVDVDDGERAVPAAEVERWPGGRRSGTSATITTSAPPVEWRPSISTERRRLPVGGGGHDRQVLHDRLDVVGARREAGVGAGGGDQADEVVAARGGRHDAGRRRHRDLERLAGVGGLADVEQHGGAPLPGQLVLADQELVVAGRGRPVDAAQVVADDVGPQRVEVLAGAARASWAAGRRPAGRGRWCRAAGRSGRRAGTR